MELVSKFCNTILEHINDVLCELIGIPLSPLDRGFDFPESCLVRVVKSADMRSKLSHKTVELTSVNILLKVADDQVFQDHRGNPDHMLFLPRLICELIQNLWDFHEHEFLEVDVCQSCLLV